MINKMLNKYAEEGSKTYVYSGDVVKDLQAIKDKIKELIKKYNPKIYQDGTYCHYYDYIKDLQQLIGDDND